VGMRSKCWYCHGEMVNHNNWVHRSRKLCVAKPYGSKPATNIKRISADSGLYYRPKRYLEQLN
jgi:hypothetical protein